MMARMQISLEPELQRQAREKATQCGLSFAEYIRRLVRRDLGEPPPQASPAVVFDLGDSGGTDIARTKDQLLGEAVAGDVLPSPAGS